MKSTSVSLLLLWLLVAIPTLTEATSNHTSNTTEGHNDHHGEHHGVALASWRWSKYSTTITFSLMIILAAIFKIGFHHLPIIPEHVPESCVLILLGCLAGFFIYFGPSSVRQHLPEFENDLFFNVLLPPIILDSAFSLYDRDFLSNLGSVLLFAIVGTLYNVFLIGGFLKIIIYSGLMGSTVYQLSFLECLIFSSLISAVDPVAVLAIFEEIGVNMGLYFLVFGESLLNDGVTIVIYSAVTDLSNQETIAPTDYILAILKFFTVAGGGFLIGVLFGLLTALILKFTEHARVVEPLIVMAMAYFGFIITETVHWSGIISIIGCGIVQKRYAFPNASKKTRTTIKYGVQTMSSIADAIIFLFLGTVVISSSHDFEIYFVLWTLFLCLVIRFSGVFGLSWLVNQRRLKPITYKEQFIMAYGGLRGAIGFSLAALIPASAPYKNLMTTTTIIVIFFTVFIQGSTIKVLVNELNITRKAAKDKSIGRLVNDKTLQNVMAGVEAVLGHVSRYTLLEAVEKFDDRYVKAFLIKKGTLHNIAQKLQNVTMDEHYARLYGPTVLIAESNINAMYDSSSEQADFEEDDQKRLGVCDRATIQRAFKDTPFERYHSRRLGQFDSEGDLLNQIDRAKKTASLIGRRLAEEEAMKNRIARSYSDGEDQQSVEKRVNARLKWQGAGSKSATAALVKKQYFEAKNKFKSNVSELPD